MKQDKLKLEDVKRWPETASGWLDKEVLIWSGEHRAWWNPHAAGYTPHKSLAGRYPFKEAYVRTHHCGPEKKIVFVNAHCCFRHRSKPAFRRGNIPCAPGGGLWLCEACAAPGAEAAVFKAYKAGHAKEITCFKGKAGHE